MSWLNTQTNRLAGHLAAQRYRLIGMSLLRVILGAASILYYVSDYSRREFFWGPSSYNSLPLAEHTLGPGAWSLYFASHSQLWFELVFHAGLAVAIVFTIFGGRWLTLLQAIFLWSIYDRNQDILEGGDNLARILIIFLLLCVSNAYFAPGARERRGKLLGEPAGTKRILVHNLGVMLIVFQVAELYFVAGYSKITGSVWSDGVAMYYISRESMFQSVGLYSAAMANPFIGTLTSYITIAIEMAFPFAILSRRAWLRKGETLMVEGLHGGIIVFMGLVCFGLIMIGADCTALRDEDYRSLGRLARTGFQQARARLARPDADASPVDLDLRPLSEVET